MSDEKQTKAGIQHKENKAPLYTSDANALLPNENIVHIAECERINKWVAIQCNPDGTLHCGTGNTEILARRIAALEGLHSIESKAKKPDTSKLSPESHEYLKWKEDLRDLSIRQARIVDYLLHGLHTSSKDIVRRSEKLAEEREIIDTVIMMIQAIGVSIHSIHQLSDSTDMTVRDCYSIARSVVEATINVAFIMASGPKVAHLARQYTLQKYYRDLNREAEVANTRIQIQHTNAPNPSSIPGLQDALKMFTTKKGKEIKMWARETRDQKIEIVCDKYGKSVAWGLATANFSVYRDASEVIHGSHFGANYFWQPSLSSNPNSNFDNAIEHLFHHFLLVFTSTYFSVDSMFKIFDIEYDTPKIISESDRLFNELKSMDLFADKSPEKTQ